MLSHRDVSALMGLTRDTTMWELWHINKGNIERSAEVTSRRFWSNQLRPHVIDGLNKRYNCQIGALESRIANGVVRVTAAPIHRTGSLPTGEAAYLVVNMISTEGYRHTYGQTEDPFLPTDRVQASLIQEAFGADAVAFFMFIGNGEKEDFMILPRCPDTEQAVDDVVRAYKRFVEEDQEPEPDFELNGKALGRMAAFADETMNPYRGDEDQEFKSKIERYLELGSEMSAVSAKEKQLKTEREIIKGFLAGKLRGHSHGVLGNSMVKFRRQVRNVKPRTDEYIVLDIKQ